jgi:hypothetical protein
MQQSRSLARLAKVKSRIRLIRAVKVILDEELAAIYGVSSQEFKRAMRVNRTRFPNDFMFQLTSEEAGTIRTRSSAASERDDRYPAFAFTVHGALMAAHVLSSASAVARSVYVICAFIPRGKELIANGVLENRLIAIEKTLLIRKSLLSHNPALRRVITKVSPLLAPEGRHKRRIAFHTDQD